MNTAMTQKNILLFGPQGSGKGTQGERLASRWGVPLIGTGALLRAEAKQTTPRGRQVDEELRTGKLISESITNEILFDRLRMPDTEQGFILDGYPRNKTQEEALRAFLQTLRGGTIITHAIVLELSDAEAVARLADRRICAMCGNVYHLKNHPPQKENVCDGCGGALQQRTDDTAEALQKRLAIYHNDTTPLVADYEREEIVHRVDAHGTIEEVAERIASYFL